jgi:hypothetical protein
MYMFTSCVTLWNWAQYRLYFLQIEDIKIATAEAIDNCYRYISLDFFVALTK